MRQYVLTRSAFDPDIWPSAANRQRLAVTRAVTAPLVAAQTARDFAWVVLLHPRDPYLEQRLALYGDAAPRFVPLVWDPAQRPRGPGGRRRMAAADYRAPWREALGERDEPLLMARIDDDDGFTPDALERVRRAALRLRKRTVLMEPMGFWTYRGVYIASRHDHNAMHTLYTPAHDEAVVYDYSHTRCRTFAPTVVVDMRPAWLWVRHGQTISGRALPRHFRAGRPTAIDATLRATFPIDWDALARCWR